MKIVVLAGGISTERDVSLITGKQVYVALKERKHQVVLLDVYMGFNMQEQGVVNIEDIFSIEKDWSKEIGAISENAPNLEAIKALRQENTTGFFGPNVIEVCKSADIVFMGLHGSNGEDGRVQAAFDLHGIKYTGSNYVGATLSMDKGLSKTLFETFGIPTPKGTTRKKEQMDFQTEKLTKIPYPVIVKTCCGGSSVGVYIAQNHDEYIQALKEAFVYEDEVVVEQYVKGREFSIGVMENKALPIIEIAPLEGFYDYKNKYQAGSAVETCPANLDDDVTKRMQETAEAVFKVLRLDTYARMDFVMDEHNNFYCLEANTLPGMTPTSLLPQEAAAIGISYGDLCEKIIEISLKKFTN